MKLEPLKQWICDTCNELIAKPEDGWLEWRRVDIDAKDFRNTEYRVCHQLTKSPLREENEEGCYRHKRGRLDNHLYYFLGPTGMVSLLSEIDAGPIIDPNRKSIGLFEDHRNWAETFRRLHVPHYEEARQYFAEAQADGYFEGMNEVAVYSEETLKGIINEYGEKE